tara:strand:- start:422 stop:682 length:261 start_codon:yes stop_codon:yes gene_type:complete
MSQIINNRKTFSLSEISRSLKKTISERYKSSFWVQAEMNKLNFYAQSGHCYPDISTSNFSTPTDLNTFEIKLSFHLFLTYFFGFVY